MFNKMNMTATETNILAFMCQHPEREWHVRALAKEMGISLGSSSQELKKLQALGLVYSRQVGNLRLYNLATDKPIIRSFKVFLNLLALEPIVKELKDHSERIILFGSTAEGTDTEKSDFDVLIVTLEKEQIRQRLTRYRTVIGRQMSPVIVTPLELVKLSKTDKALYDQATKGTVIWRSDHE
jgi:predicted nucleotidyltransferase